MLLDRRRSDWWNRDLRPTRPRLGMPLRDRRLVVEPPCSRRRVPTQLTRDRRLRPGERGERSRGRRDSALGAARCPRVRRTTGIGRSRGAGRRQRRGQVDAREAAPAFLRPRHRRAHHYTLNPEEPLHRQSFKPNRRGRNPFAKSTGIPKWNSTFKRAARKQAVADAMQRAAAEIKAKSATQDRERADVQTARPGMLAYSPTSPTYAVDTRRRFRR